MLQVLELHLLPILWLSSFMHQSCSPWQVLLDIITGFVHVHACSNILLRDATHAKPTSHLPHLTRYGREVLLLPYDRLEGAAKVLNLAILWCKLVKVADQVFQRVLFEAPWP